MKKVTEIMRSGKGIAVDREDMCFREVLEELNNNLPGSVCILEERRLVGIVTDGDVRRLILRTQDSLPELFMKKVGKFMTRNPRVVSPETSLDGCLKILNKERLWVIPVVDENKMFLGIVHMQDLLDEVTK